MLSHCIALGSENASILPCCPSLPDGTAGTGGVAYIIHKLIRA